MKLHKTQEQQLHIFIHKSISSLSNFTNEQKSNENKEEEKVTAREIRKLVGKNTKPHRMVRGLAATSELRFSTRYVV